MLSYKIYLDKDTVIDVLKYSTLSKQLPKIKKKCFKYNKLVNEELFREEVRGWLSYQYRGRFEYERLIYDAHEQFIEKVDVYTLVMANFDVFIEYLINHIKEV